MRVCDQADKVGKQMLDKTSEGNHITDDATAENWLLTANAREELLRRTGL